jgi:diguanylate cyclase (GGDEF)-like protein
MWSPSPCISDEALKALAESVGSPGLEAATERRLELAWHLRQRDGAQALRLAQQASAQAVGTGSAARSLSGWALVLQAEVHWLFGNVQAAEEQLNAALVAFEAAKDGAGLCEAHALGGMMAHDAGDRLRREEGFETAAMHARLHGDTQRALIAQAAQAACEVEEGRARATGALGALEDHNGHLAGLWTSEDGVLQAWASYLVGKAALASGNFRNAGLLASQCWETARGHGMLWMAADAARQAGLAFAALGDQLGAVEWVQRALTLAQEAGWPMSLCEATQSMARCLLMFEQWEQAHGFIKESSAMAQSIPAPRIRVAQAALQGATEEAVGVPDAALAAWREHEHLCIAQGLVAEHAQSLCAQSRLLTALGRLELADTAARSGISIAVMQGNLQHVSSAWHALAAVRRAVVLSPSEQAVPGESVLHCLEQALTAAQALGGAVPETILVETAAEHHRLGNHAAAYRLCLEARTAAQSQHAERVANLTVALEVRLHTDQARAAAAHNQKVAAELAARVQDLSHSLAQMRNSQAALETYVSSLEQDNHTLEDLRMIDLTTGLSSRRCAERLLALELPLCLRNQERAARAGSPPQYADTLLFLIDINRLGWVHQSCGPKAAERVLSEVAQRLTTHTRACDYTARWDASEFLVVARSTSRSRASELAFRLRAALSEAAYRDDGGTPMRLSCSIGVACFPLAPEHPTLHSRDEVLALLGQALRRAKGAGPGACVEAQAATPETGSHERSAVRWAPLT